MIKLNYRVIRANSKMNQEAAKEREPFLVFIRYNSTQHLHIQIRFTCPRKSLLYFSEMNPLISSTNI